MARTIEEIDADLAKAESYLGASEWGAAVGAAGEWKQELLAEKAALLPPVIREAATTLEALQAQLAEARAEVERLTGERDRQYDENVHRIAEQASAEADRDRLSTLLKEAVEGLRAIAGIVDWPDPDMGFNDLARSLLAKLEERG